MRLDEKQRITAELADRLSQAETILITDFTGLDVKAVTDLRRRLRAEGVEYRVVKNTLARRAIEGLELDVIDEHLVGPTALLLAGDDPVAPAKIIKEFAKEQAGVPVVKIAIVDRRPITPENVAAMAELPSRLELFGSIAGGLTSSVSGIVGAVSAVIRDIAHMVEEVAKKGAAAAPAESAETETEAAETETDEAAAAETESPTAEGAESPTAEAEAGDAEEAVEDEEAGQDEETEDEAK